MFDVQHSSPRKNSRDTHTTIESNEIDWANEIHSLWLLIGVVSACVCCVCCVCLFLLFISQIALAFINDAVN